MSDDRAGGRDVHYEACRGLSCPCLIEGQRVERDRVISVLVEVAASYEHQAGVTMARQVCDQIAERLEPCT